MKKPPRHKAIVRAFDIILTFDSDKSDEVMENEIIELIDKINSVLKREFLKQLPQLSVDAKKGGKKMKIGITSVFHDDDE